MSIYPPYSHWERDIWLDNIDVAIIGGGIVGLSAALHLKNSKPNLRVHILERSIIGTAASTRNAGFACYGSPTELMDDMKDRSEDAVFELVERRIKGLELLRSTVGDAQLKYHHCGGYEMFTDRSNFEEVLDHLDEINRSLSSISSGLRYRPTDDHPLDDVAGVLMNEWEGQIHPGAMYRSLELLCRNAGVRILRGVSVTAVHSGSDVKIQTVQRSLTAKQVIITTNAFASDLIPDISTKAGRNMVLLTKPIDGLKLDGCFHYDRGYVYFRNVGDRVLIGGGRNIASAEETTSAFGINEQIRTYLTDILGHHILKNEMWEMDQEWSGILAFNETKDPIIKSVAPHTYAAVGLGGMGVAIGSLVGREVAELLLQS